MSTTKCLLPLVVVLLAPAISWAEWEPEVRLTNDPSESVTCFDNAWAVAAAGTTIHVVWHDARDGNTEIYYKRSLDNGTTWSADTRITNDASWSERPSVAVRDSIVHVAWYDGRLGPPRIFYKHSLDNGVTWGADVSLTPTAGVGYHPSVATCGSMVHVAWTDMSAGPQIYYTRSLDDGTTWDAEKIITPHAPAAGKNLASIAVADSIVHVTWMDSRSNPQIYYTRSCDHGATWETDRSITPVPSQFASVAVSDSIVHVVYADFRFGTEVPMIYYTRSLDSGTSWQTEVQLGESSASWYPSVAVAGSHVHTVWLDNRNGDISEVYYKCSLDDGVNWESDVRLTDNTSESREPSVAVSGTYVHVVWNDDRDQNLEIYYKRGSMENTGVRDDEETSLAELHPLVAPTFFRDGITFRLDDPLSGPMRVVLFDVLGVPVCGATYGADPSFVHLGDARIPRLAPGVYFLRMEAGKLAATQKLIKIR